MSKQWLEVYQHAAAQSQRCRKSLQADLQGYIMRQEGLWNRSHPNEPLPLASRGILCGLVNMLVLIEKTRLQYQRKPDRELLHKFEEMKIVVGMLERNFQQSLVNGNWKSKCDVY